MSSDAWLTLRRDGGEENKRKTPRQMEQGYYCLQALRRPKENQQVPFFAVQFCIFFQGSMVLPSPRARYHRDAMSNGDMSSEMKSSCLCDLSSRSGLRDPLGHVASHSLLKSDRSFSKKKRKRKKKTSTCFTVQMSRSPSPRDLLGGALHPTSTNGVYIPPVLSLPTRTTTATMSNRPLPALSEHRYQYPPRSSDRFPFASPYYVPHHYPQYRYPQDDYPDLYEEPATSSFPVGTILHKGFYDLLSMIPTPSPSQFLAGWRASPPSNNDSIAGPRYEELDTARIKSMPKKGRKVSKDMVSKPTGFV